MINLTEVVFSSSYYQGHADFLDCRIAEEAGLIHRGIHLVELRRSTLKAICPWKNFGPYSRG